MATTTNYLHRLTTLYSVNVSWSCSGTYSSLRMWMEIVC